jgi:hypothetical protein
MTSTDDTVNQLETAEREARVYASWLAAHGYHEASLWMFSTTLNNYGPGDRRTETAVGYAVRYAGTFIRDDGSRAEYPTAGITVFCQDSQLPLTRLIKDGRALVTSGTGDRDEYGPYTPYYVSHYNPRVTGVQQDQSVNPGTVPTAGLRELTPLIGGDGPLRFFDLRLVPAGDLATGTRVRTVSGDYAGQTGTVKHPHARMPLVELEPAYDPVADTTRPWGLTRQIPRTDLEPAPDSDG